MVCSLSCWTKARFGSGEVPRELHFEFRPAVLGQQAVQPAPTALKQAQIAPIGAIHTVRLLGEHPMRAQAERHMSCKRDCQNQPLNVLRIGEMRPGQAKAAGLTTAEQSFDPEAPRVHQVGLLGAGQA